MIAIANPIQKGDNTHHHDQSITLHSLRIIKVNPNSIGKLMALDEDFEFDII